MKFLLLGLIVVPIVIYFILLHYRVKRFASNPLNKWKRPQKSFQSILKQIFPKSNFDIYIQHSLDQKPDSLKKELNFTEKRKSLDSLSVMSGLGESAWVGAEMIHNLQAVDEHVFATISQMANAQLNTIGDLHQHIHDWAQSWYGGLTDSVVTKLQGHVAEQFVAEHLNQLGHTVTIAGDSNQEGYDMLVDGHPFNIKDLLGMNSIHEHFEKFPDIGVIANADISGHPDSVLHIDATQGLDQLHNLDSISNDHLLVLDHGLRHADVVEQVHDAGDAIIGNVPFHIPFITLGLSSFRETKLLLKRHTDIVTSLKNIGLDVAGTGMGLFLGAKAGGAIGTMITPGVGTAIGGVIGGIAGAIGGRLMSNKAKMEPLKKVKSIYESDMKVYQEKFTNVDEQSKKEYDALVESENNKLKIHANAEIEKINNLKENLLSLQKQSYVLSDDKLRNLFEIAQDAIKKQILEVETRLGEISFFDRFIWITEYCYKLKEQREAIETDLKEFIKAFNNIFLEETALTQEQKTTMSFEILSAFGVIEEPIVEHLSNYKNVLESNRDKLLSEIDIAKKQVAEKRHISFRTIKETIDKIKNWADAELKNVTYTLKISQESLVVEMKKLGIEVK